MAYAAEEEGPNGVQGVLDGAPGLLEDFQDQDVLGPALPLRQGCGHAAARLYHVEVGVRAARLLRPSPWHTQSLLISDLSVSPPSMVSLAADACQTVHGLPRASLMRVAYFCYS